MLGVEVFREALVDGSDRVLLAGRGGREGLGGWGGGEVGRPLTLGRGGREVLLGRGGRYPPPPLPAPNPTIPLTLVAVADGGRCAGAVPRLHPLDRGQHAQAHRMGVRIINIPPGHCPAELSHLKCSDGDCSIVLNYLYDRSHLSELKIAQ